MVVHQRFIEPLESILQKNPKTFITQDDIKKIFSVIRSVALAIWPRKRGAGVREC